MTPTIDKGALEDRKLKTGQTIEYDVTISGEPFPEVVWMLNGQPLKPSERTSIKTSDKTTKLITTNAQRYNIVPVLYKLVFLTYCSSQPRLEKT